MDKPTAALATRTHVILPAKLLEEIDLRVGRRRRSEFMREAAERALRQMNLVEFLSRSKPAWSHEDHPEFAKGSAAWVRGLRQAELRRKR